MKDQSHHPLSKMEKYKNLPLISEQELEQQQQKIMRHIASSQDQSIDTSPTLFNRRLAWSLAAAAVISFIIWRPWQDQSPKLHPTKPTENTASVSEQLPSEDSAFIAVKNEKNGVQTEEIAIPYETLSTGNLEQLWSEITIEEMEIYLLEEEEF